MAIPLKDALLAPYVANWQSRTMADYATFGLTEAQATALAAVCQPYLDAWTALQAARNAGIRSEAQTAEKSTKRALMLITLRELYALVQASRSVSDGDKSLLGITVPSQQRSPRPGPGAVSNFSARINGDGSITIKWKANNPPGTQGTVYQVWRRLDDGAFTHCSGSGAKEFTDTTVPPGTASIRYRVQPMRSTKTGPWSEFNVNFGGGMSVRDAAGVKIAA